MRGLSHVDTDGKARMVDVSEKPDTVREAVARGAVLMRPSTLALIQQNAIQKGDVLSVAKIAGIMAAKRTAELIPLCHPLPLTNVELTFSFNAGRIEIESRARVTGKTGVEMEALSAVAVAALTVYDMCKAVDREMAIADIRLVEKRGGRSGTFRRPGEQV